MRFGGTEEAIVRRGSDWCTDQARVAVAVLQTRAIPARFVLLADTARAYSGHTIIEAFREGRWGCMDPTTAVIYRDPKGRPASAWDLVRHPGWIERHHSVGTAEYSTRSQFRRVALGEYRIRPATHPGYRTSRVNPYYRKILGMSERGWPGGRRWLFGEGVGPGQSRRMPAN
jgi:hypothetical protein